MKRRASRLSLHRETLTTLSRSELERPLGADLSKNIPCITQPECYINPSIYISNCLSYCGTCDQACFLTTSQAC